MLWGETGEIYDDSDCGSSYISTFLTWADAHGVGYEPWTWGTFGSLISDHNGTRANAYGALTSKPLRHTAVTDRAERAGRESRVRHRPRLRGCRALHSASA